ncbi:MAG: hypothetical protein AB8B81_15790 [Halioglobus sp.]
MGERDGARLVPSVLSLLSLSVAVLLAFSLLAAWYRYHPHMPWRDTLPLLRNLMPLLTDGWSTSAALSLIEPHYTAHRVLVPRLLLFADIEFLGGRSHLLFASGVLGLALIWLSFSSLAIQRLRGDFWSRLFAVSLSAAVLLAPAHLWNFLNPICSSWPLSIGLSVAALYLLVSRRQQLGAPLLTVVYCLALLAAFSNFLGVLVWLLLPLPLIAGREKYWYLSVIASAVFVFLYLQGIDTDAEIAISIADGHPDNSEMQTYASQVRELVALNGPMAILSKSVLSLGAPLSLGHPAIAAGLVVLSLVFPLGFLFAALRRWWLREERLSQWAELCLLGCTLCIGAALSTHLGRVMPYPDVIHGASPERYQSYVLAYWIFCLGLLMEYAISLRTNRAKWLPVLASVVLAIIVIAPRPDYLREEIRSAEHAAMLYSIGESDNLRIKLPETGLLYTAEYALGFRAFFAQRSLAYKRGSQGPAGGSLPSCKQLGLRSIAGMPNEALTALVKNPKNLRQISVELETWRAVVTRDMVVFVDGKMLTRLTPVQEASYTPIDLLKPSETQWRGGYMGKAVNLFSSADIRINGLLGFDASCRLDLS